MVIQMTFIMKQKTIYKKIFSKKSDIVSHYFKFL